MRFRHERALASHYHLPHRSADKSSWGKRTEPGLAIDLTRDGRPIEIEILAPEKLTLTTFRRVLRGPRFPKRADRTPLKA